MTTNIVRIAMSFVAMVVLATVSVPTLAASKDLTGTWNVDGDVYGNPVQYTLTLQQDGTTLTGTAKFKDKDEEIPVTGSTAERTVTWKFDVDYNGSPLTIEFTGALSSETDIAGSIAVSGASGKFTAKRA